MPGPAAKAHSSQLFLLVKTVSGRSRQGKTDVLQKAAIPADSIWVTLTPGTFVVLWASGFIGGKLGLPYIEPATFLMLRFALVIALMLPMALLWRAPWPSSPRQFFHIGVAGILMQGCYLYGVFAAIHHGISAGLVALIVGMQPVLTALVAGALLGERVSRLQWAGLGLGLAGVALVVMQKATLAGVSVESIGGALAALAGITFGTMYQKRFCGAFDLRTGSVIQFVAAAIVIAPFSWLFESRVVHWSPQLVFALAWLVLVLSIGAISMLTLLIRRGAVTKVASLMYLTPPVTAIMAWLVFGETLSTQALLGLGLAAAGVALVVRN
jgi:drug/metabolite transporter (DMT)-like permease